MDYKDIDVFPALVNRVQRQRALNAEIYDYSRQTAERETKRYRLRNMVGDLLVITASLSGLVVLWITALTLAG